MTRTATLTSSLLVSLLIAGGSSAAQSAPAAECRMSQIAITLGPYISEQTEQHTLALRLVNRGTQMCVFFGYPRVTFYDARGVLPFLIRHHDQMISVRRPKTVQVRPGGAAFLVLNKNACTIRSSRLATVLNIATPRPATGVASFRFPRHMPFPYRDPDFCPGDIGSLIAISPFVPTVRAALDG
jgi:Domain of unknown function (DUF4232)